MTVYPGDTETVLIQTNSMAKDKFTNHQLSINMHAGTHIDGPMHLTHSDVYLNEVAIDTFIGEGCLIDVSGETNVDYKDEYEQLITEGQIVIVYTGHSACYGQSNYYTDYPILTDAFADLLVRKKVKMVGLDTPSPDRVPFDIHKKLLKNNILIIENLTNLKQLIGIEAFEVIALPLHIRADSSIARVVARVK